MSVVVLGAGLMGHAICFDLVQNAHVSPVTLVDQDELALHHVKKSCTSDAIKTYKIDISDADKLQDLFLDNSVVISAVPYFYNEILTKTAIENNAHFIDLGGNNTIVSQQKQYHDLAEEHGVTIIPDCGLAPGLVSVITKDIVDEYSDIEFVKLRVGGLPIKPKPPLDYEIVFSPNGLINEYVEDAIILSNGRIQYKPSMTELETIIFPEPFGTMEAFITSGGCSTLPNTFKDTIQYLDYKTIRYPGHCEKFKTLLDLGLGSLDPISLHGSTVIPRQLLIKQLNHFLPKTGEDVVLLKVLAQAKKNDSLLSIEYEMIDYMDPSTGLTAMMRTTGFPVSITAHLLLKGIIKTPGVFTPEEIIPSTPLFDELQKRNITLNKSEQIVS